MKFDRRLTDEIYTSDTVRLGKNAFQAMQETIYHNGGVGTITGYYDAELSILSVSDLLLHNLNHSYASLMEQTKGSLKNLFYKKDAAFLDNARFRQIQGEGEGRILTADGAPVYVRLYKKDAVDTDGTPIWIMSVQMNWAYENLALVNESIHSALWYFECNENGEIVHVNWSHAFRQILGYHDILDFPNKLDSWSNLLHPEDYDRVMQLLLETIVSACVTAFAGPISFVGIAVPHLIKLATHTAKPIILIPGCFLGGAVITLFCDGIARTVFAPTEISISSVTAVFLVPVVIAAMLRKQRM